jgi:hypothetical protein
LYGQSRFSSGASRRAKGVCWTAASKSLQIDWHRLVALRQDGCVLLSLNATVRMARKLARSQRQIDATAVNFSSRKRSAHVPDRSSKIDAFIRSHVWPARVSGRDWRRLPLAHFPSLARRRKEAMYQFKKDVTARLAAYDGELERARAFIGRSGSAGLGLFLKPRAKIASSLVHLSGAAFRLSGSALRLAHSSTVQLQDGNSAVLQGVLSMANHRCDGRLSLRMLHSAQEQWSSAIRGGGRGIGAKRAAQRFVLRLSNGPKSRSAVIHHPDGRQELVICYREKVGFLCLCAASTCPFAQQVSVEVPALLRSSLISRQGSAQRVA